jgi:tetratricopeptide (TPR) repeat protein
MGQACDLWWMLWNKTISWIDDRKIESIEKLDQLPKGLMTQYYKNWIQDFDMQLHNASIHHKHYVQMSLEYSRAFLQRFPKSNDDILHTFRSTEGESLFKLNRFNESNEVFKKLIEDYPANVWGYINWGDLCNPEMNRNKPNNGERALEIYRQGLGEIRDNHELTALMERIEELV